MLAAFGRLPGGPALYRRLTRHWLGTQATHVDKLQRVLPGYLETWHAHGLDVEAAAIWIHEPGYTPFWPFACHLLTGTGGVHTNGEARMLHRYVATAANQAATMTLPGADSVDRRRLVAAQRWADTLDEALDAVGATVHEGVDPSRVPLPDASADLCHSGGTLEHYRPRQLLRFLRECARVVRPGGLISHVIDHRDHLRHADPSWPFLQHQAWSNAVYGIVFDHPLGYHNRMPPSHVAQQFHDAGLDLIDVRRMSLPSRAYVDDPTRGEAGISRDRLARRFRNLSEPDRHTAAAHYLARVPDGRG